AAGVPAVVAVSVGPVGGAGAALGGKFPVNPAPMVASPARQMGPVHVAKPVAIDRAPLVLPWTPPPTPVPLRTSGSATVTMPLVCRVAPGSTTVPPAADPRGVPK